MKEVIKKCNGSMKWAYISGLQYLFKAWLIILQNSVYITDVMSYAIDFAQITILLISSFMQLTFSIPFGEREEVLFSFLIKFIKFQIIRVNY